MSAPSSTVAGRNPAPGLLRTLASAVLLDGRGDVELLRETRGAEIDWGGVYAQHVRLTGPWRISIEVDGTSVDLPSSVMSTDLEGDRFRSLHLVGGLRLVQRIVPLASPPGAVRTLTITSAEAAAKPVCVTSRFVPYLLPVMVEGIRPVDFLVETGVSGLRVRHRGFALGFTSDVLPSRLYVDRASWRGGRRRGRAAEIASDHELRVGAGVSAEIRFLLVGGLERDLDHTPRTPGTSIPDPETVAGQLALEEAAWSGLRPELAFPDAPELERAYDQARSALRRLYTQPAPGMTGLVAGYPWYSTIWCRDLAWMLPAVLWLGDHAWVSAAIDSVLRLQATRELELLGAEAGELPMQISPGPVFLFGTSDTTLHYPALALRSLRHSGAAGSTGSWKEALERAIAWGERRTDPRTGLFRNGGEVALLERAAQRYARVRYGIDAPDTTIWDSTDRRDHAIDLQVLWWEALRAAVALEGPGTDAATHRRRTLLIDQLEGSIRGLYRWPEEGYLYDSLRAGEPVRRLRPNALRAVSAGLFEPEVARAIVRRASAEDLTTPWGVRTLSSRDPGYRADAYHDGQVWTIATAWAADAAFAAGERELGLTYLRTIAARLATEAGGANECYRGDRPEPYDSCFLLGFSVAPFLTVIFERLWGLTPDATVPRLEVRPGFPPSWRSASLDGLRLGDGRVSLRFRDGELEVGWTGPRPLELVGRRDRASVPGGSRARISAR